MGDKTDAMNIGSIGSVCGGVVDVGFDEHFPPIYSLLHTKKGEITIEIMGDGAATLQALIREYLFVSLFRTCAEFLARENASRLATMQRADKNIDELLADVNGKHHRLHQVRIDEELFEVIAGFEALGGEKR